MADEAAENYAYYAAARAKAEADLSHSDSMNRLAWVALIAGTGLAVVALQLPQNEVSAFPGVCAFAAGVWLWAGRRSRPEMLERLERLRRQEEQARERLP